MGKGATLNYSFRSRFIHEWYNCVLEAHLFLLRPFLTKKPNASPPIPIFGPAKTKKHDISTTTTPTHRTERVEIDVPHFFTAPLASNFDRASWPTFKKLSASRPLRPRKKTMITGAWIIHRLRRNPPQPPRRCVEDGTMSIPQPIPGVNLKNTRRNLKTHRRQRRRCSGCAILNSPSTPHARHPEHALSKVTAQSGTSIAAASVEMFPHRRRRPTRPTLTRPDGVSP